MKLVWTESALADLDEILAYAAEHYPSLIGPLERRIRAAVARIATTELSRSSPKG